MVGCEHVQPRVRRFECTGTLQSPQIRGQLPRGRGHRAQRWTKHIDALTPPRRLQGANFASRDIADGEPYVNGEWPYLVRAAQWCRTHKMQMWLDLHTAPGSQNGFDNSGRFGEMLWSTDAAARWNSARNRA